MARYIKTKQKCPMPVPGQHWVDGKCPECKWWRGDRCLFDGMMKREANVFFESEKRIAEYQNEKADAEYMIDWYKEIMKRDEALYSSRADMRLKLDEMKQNKRR